MLAQLDFTSRVTGDYASTATSTLTLGVATATVP